MHLLQLTHSVQFESVLLFPWHGNVPTGRDGRVIDCKFQRKQSQKNVSKGPL